MAAPSYVIAITNSVELLRRAVNAVFADVKAKQPAYGAALPGTVGADGQLTTSPGGLASALSSLTTPGTHWVGWAGPESGRMPPFEHGDLHLHPVPLSNEEVERYYAGFSNAVLWLRDRRPTGLGKLEALAPSGDALFRSLLETSGRADYLYARCRKGA